MRRLLDAALAPLRAYARWLHTGWPAGTVERLPVVAEDGSTAVPGLYVVGDLTGVPLLKLAADGGAAVVQAIARDPALARLRQDEPDADVADIAIIGAGVSGMSAALEARRLGLTFVVLEATEPFSTIVNFPRRKPIFTYPTTLEPRGQLRLTADVKEALLDELRAQTLAAGIEPRAARVERVARAGRLLEVVLAPGGGGSAAGAMSGTSRSARSAGPRATAPALRARRVVVGIGRSGSFRKLGVPGEERDKVMNRLHDPRDFAGHDVLVVGGGDSALEAAIALGQCGTRVTLSYRKAELSRPKPANVDALQALVRDPRADVAVLEPTSERVTTSTGRYLKDRAAAAAPPGSVKLLLESQVKEVGEREVVLATRTGETRLPNDAVFTMIGREAPLDFFRRSGVAIRGEWTARSWATLAFVLLACVLVYNWKSFGEVNQAFQRHGWFPYNLPEAGGEPGLLRVLGVSLREPGFYYSLLYCACVVGFGLRRIRRRRTPYVTAQTSALMAIQCLPLFLLPYVLLPWAGSAGAFDGGWGRAAADALFPACGYGHGREYWRAFGLVLAWPLFFWNVFTAQPLAAWLAISVVQTFVLVPLLIWRWGKGAYCGWICSCGALAETLGDAQREKMPHGPGWNRLNLVGQALLVASFVLLFARAASWLWPESAAGRALGRVYSLLFLNEWGLDYYHVADLTLAGIVGVGCYFHLSGRVWCRFACPLAALMHVYARFSSFRILAEKKKCISCNVCTSVCHQGIDVMSFANKGLPMEDPECVRCSACVGACPTGTLEFGRVDRRTGAVLARDRLVASPVHLADRGRPLPVV